MFVRNTKVIEVARIRDGGTIVYKDQTGDTYYVDNRIGTKTPGRITDRYPDEPDAIVISVTLDIVESFDNISI